MWRKQNFLDATIFGEVPKLVLLPWMNSQEMIYEKSKSMKFSNVPVLERDTVMFFVWHTPTPWYGKMLDQGNAMNLTHIHS